MTLVCFIKKKLQLKWRKYMLL